MYIPKVQLILFFHEDGMNDFSEHLLNIFWTLRNSNSPETWGKASKRPNVHKIYYKPKMLNGKKCWCQRWI